MSSSKVSNKFDLLAERFHSLHNSVEPQVRVLNFGGHNTIVRSHDPGLLEIFISPFVHLLLDDKGSSPAQSPAITIDIALREDLVEPSNPLWPWDLDRYHDDLGFIQFDSNMDLIFARNVLTNHAILIFDALPESKWIRPECSRPIIERIFSLYGMASVHGGTLGVDGRCVLLTAKGGSGKSSLITAGVSRGLDTIGDDFEFLGRLPNDPRSFQLWSLYHCVKLSTDSPAWNYLALSPEENPPLPGMDKSLVNLLDFYPDRVVANQQPVAVVVPTLGTTGALIPISVEDTLTALLPTSMGMSTRKRESALALTNLVESLPCYSLTVTPNLTLAIDELTNLLSSHSKLLNR